MLCCCCGDVECVDVWVHVLSWIPSTCCVRISKLHLPTAPPPLNEGESLVSRILQLGPPGTKFLGYGCLLGAVDPMAFWFPPPFNCFILSPTRSWSSFPSLCSFILIHTFCRIYMTYVTMYNNRSYFLCANNIFSKCSMLVFNSQVITGSRLLAISIFPRKGRNTFSEWNSQNSIISNKHCVLISPQNKSLQQQKECF